MPKESLTGGGYDYVQSNTPADPKTGETWYDQSEPDATQRGKIYADVGNGPEWVVVPTLAQEDILADGTPFEGAKIGNLDMAVSEAGGTDTDLRFSLTPERVDATQRQTYLDNFGSTGFPASKTTMENVAYSPTVMDEVSASQTARDAIGTEGVGYDAIAAVAMAIGKYAAGIAGLNPSNYADIDAVASDADAMDAVSTSSTAMDAVSASQTAMDAVSASDIARTALFASTYVVEDIWSAQMPSQKIWNNYTSEVTEIDTNPFTTSLVTNSIGGYDFEIVNSGRGNDEQGLAYRGYNLDLSNKSELTVVTTGSDFESSCPLVVHIDGSNIFSVSSTHNSVTRNLDVSAYSGVHEVEFGLDYQGATASETTAVFSQIELTT